MNEEGTVRFFEKIYMKRSLYRPLFIALFIERVVGRHVYSLPHFDGSPRFVGGGPEGVIGRQSQR